MFSITNALVLSFKKRFSKGGNNTRLLLQVTINKIDELLKDPYSTNTS